MLHRNTDKVRITFPDHRAKYYSTIDAPETEITVEHTHFLPKGSGPGFDTILIHPGARSIYNRAWSDDTLTAYVTGIVPHSTFPAVQTLFSASDSRKWQRGNTLLTPDDMTSVNGISSVTAHPTGHGKDSNLVRLRAEFNDTRLNSTFKFLDVEVGPALLQRDNGEWEPSFVPSFVWCRNDEESSTSSPAMRLTAEVRKRNLAALDAFIESTFVEWKEGVQKEQERTMPGGYRFEGETGDDIVEQIYSALEELRESLQDYDYLSRRPKSPGDLA